MNRNYIQLGLGKVRTMKLLNVCFLLGIFILIQGCSNSVIKPSVEFQNSNEAKELTAGEVRLRLFKSLQNTAGIAICFVNDPLIQFSPLLGGRAFALLEKKLPFQKDSGVNAYLKGLRIEPEKTKAVLVSLYGKDMRQYIYIPNDGSYGIALDKKDDTDIDLGLLVDISIPSISPMADTKTCVTCTVESGKKGQGCACTQSAVTVCCTGSGCSPSCGTGFQCIWNCNREDEACTDLCISKLPFEDKRPFASFSPSDKF
jgi:hypothetical protein